jgi:hypothetical protein
MKDGLRPDLLIVNESGKTAEIIDVATPFENRYAAFEAVTSEKGEIRPHRYEVPTTRI